MEINLLKGKELLLTPPGVKKVNGQKPAQGGNVSIDLQSVTEEGATTTLPITAGPAELDSQLATLAQAKAEAQKFLAEIHTLINALDTSNDAEHAVFAQKIEALQLVVDSDDTTLDTIQEIVAFIKANKNVIDAISTSKLDKVTFETWIAGTFEPFVTQCAAHHHDDRYCKLDDLRLADERFPVDHYSIFGSAPHDVVSNSEFIFSSDYPNKAVKYTGLRSAVIFPGGKFNGRYSNHIVDGCFADSSVEIVVIRGGVILDKGAFRDAKSLKYVFFDQYSVSDDFLVLRAGCFSGCTSLKKIYFVNGVSSLYLEQEVFSNCSSLNVDFNYTLYNPSNSVSGAFRNCQIPEVVLKSDDVRYLNDNCMSRAFENCNVKTLTLSDFICLPEKRLSYEGDISLTGIMPTAEIIINQDVGVYAYTKFKLDFPTYTKVSCPKLFSEWIDAEMEYVDNLEFFPIGSHSVKFKIFPDRLEFRGSFTVDMSDLGVVQENFRVKNTPQIPYIIKSLGVAVGSYGGHHDPIVVDAKWGGFYGGHEITFFVECRTGGVVVDFAGYSIPF